MAEQPLNWRPIVSRRLLVAGAVFAIWALVIVSRLLFLQTVRYDDMTARAERQQLRTITAPAKRGDIVDRHGRLLAYSVDADTIYAVPTEIDDPAKAAAALCGALTGCSRKDQLGLKERLEKQRAFVYVKRQVSPDEARNVARLDLDGIGFMKESRRFYPNRDLGAHVLGYVGLDNTGLSGLEAAYDKVMLGKPGTVLVQTDARKHVYDRVERAATTGGSLELSIDERLQHIVERELKAAIDDTNADAGTAIVMDPHTGEILAMASAPTFNPNDYNASSESARRNRAVQDIYEPGSTFKLVTAAAAIEENVIRPGDLLDVSSGTIRIGKGRVIHEYAGHRYGVISFSDAIVKSSNVGAVKVGLRLGPERLGLYVNRFGFGRPGSPDFPGESPGIVWSPASLNDSALASISMGHQVAVTPLQMVVAASAIANGGNVVEPRVVRAIVSNGVRTPVEPKIVRRAITPATAAEVTGIMEAVVADGTAKGAKIPGFTVAGKTGTAEKVIDGRYSKTANHSSFVGFVPSRQPVFSIVVMLDTPRSGGRTGGVVAAPVFKRIAEAALRLNGVPPSIAPPPAVVVARRDPNPVTQVVRKVAPRPILTLPGGSEAAVVPDVRGLGARDALRTLARLGLTARMQGAGIVIEQTPEPGEAFEPGAVCALVLHRDPSRLLGPGGAQP